MAYGAGPMLVLIKETIRVWSQLRVMPRAGVRQCRKTRERQRQVHHPDSQG